MQLVQQETEETRALLTEPLQHLATLLSMGRLYPGGRNDKKLPVVHPDDQRAVRAAAHELEDALTQVRCPDAWKETSRTLAQADILHALKPTAEDHPRRDLQEPYTNHPVNLALAHEIQQQLYDIHDALNP